MRSSTATRERARPLLGTIVRVRVGGDSEADAAIDAAFAEIAAIHRLMSFQEPDSDLGRIGLARAGEAVGVDARTDACLAAALHWAEASGGAFDPVAATGAGNWRDLAIEEGAVRVVRAARVDLSGIAKGYAVDRACAALAEHGIAQAVVEAGGDLRVIGPAEEPVALRPAADAPPAMIALAEGALASSDPALARAQGGAAHRDGRDGTLLPDHFVAVAAPCCADADALTKIVLALGAEAVPLLDGVGAVAWRFDGGAWATLGAAA